MNDYEKPTNTEKRKKKATFQSSFLLFLSLAPFVFKKFSYFYDKFRKQFLNFQLQSVEYLDTCIWKFKNL